MATDFKFGGDAHCSVTHNMVAYPLKEGYFKYKNPLVFYFFSVS